MHRHLLILCFVLLLYIIPDSGLAKKQSSLTQIDDIKEFKKLTKSKTNILVLFINNNKKVHHLLNIFKEVAEKLKARATLVTIDCTSQFGKKLCKKLKINADVPYSIKHYKNGEFNKDYDRQETVNSLSNFLLDPNAEDPWEEDPSAADVYHLTDGKALTNFLKKGASTAMKAMVLFYAPWCGYCKILKPEYVKAAGELQSEAMLAAIDVSKPGNSKLRTEYNITGFPTILYYERGQFRYVYNGDNKLEAIVKFVKNPSSQPEKVESVPDPWDVDTQLLHLTGDNFDSTLAQIEHAVVVFYAPWCGHCKNLKPELIKAEERLRNEKMNGKIAAVDATAHKELGSRYNVKGYPSIKYFNYGQFKYDINARTEAAVVNFLKNPQEPPKSDPEVPWRDEESSVRHLSSNTFKQALRKIKHALVMFYAPWCGHCKRSKPEYIKAAEAFADNLLVMFGAVDCTVETGLCSELHVKSYPTFKYYKYYDSAEDYTGGRKTADFVQFIHTQISVSQEQQKGVKKHDQTGFGVNVIIGNDGNYETVLGSNQPSFVMFHAMWCDHCNEVKPNFSRLATKLKSDKINVNIVAVDAMENPKVSDFAGIKSLPTFKLYSSLKELRVYDGDRSIEDMYTFCKTAQKI
ncbi:protein disulfide-isomerase A5 isoform X2 [Leptidea sinapis]|uniref:protein disulfide-isomerase A5 isoform X2 n=1 Tax=Leptidea sinapis TaxID=189913 RepID=UPI0021433835|nr:protein disulfide-isomerase A5 isoform X2 [Leptidea sinapis]